MSAVDDAETVGDPEMVDVATDVDAAGQIALMAAILLALIGIIGAMVKMWPAIMNASHHAEAANKAVNNVGPGEHTIYDMAQQVRHDVAELLAEQKRARAELVYLTRQQRAFESKGWNALPPDIGTAPALTAKIRTLEHTDSVIVEQLADLRKFLEAHDAWERSQKYPPNTHQ